MIITVDEIHAANCNEISQLAASVQHFIQDRLPVGLVFAGLPAAVSDLLNEGVATFLRRADKIDLHAAAVRDVEQYGMRDKPNAPDPEDAGENIQIFDEFWESPELGIEQILVKQVPARVLRGFLDEVVLRDDYPANCAYACDQVADADLATLAAKVLKARRGDNFGFGYTGILIDQCQAESELPAFIRDALLTIDEQLGADVELDLDDQDDSMQPAATESAE
ncbi:hypothetical protein [Arthrobacter bambusae]|uniref:hypothetical protein n=1 Tax=Arthrobacter bambusae TaxID=1338426 RepID=UPI002787677D|nr:hypothetical protein [Arthrobacter bambusae]MDQ0029383.1 hypothetical protein [Arthrobacter bambusae]MDQ0097043.1 hypothetical protein [Arthrobacter bambusae]